MTGARVKRDDQKPFAIFTTGALVALGERLQARPLQHLNGVITVRKIPIFVGRWEESALIERLHIQSVV